MRADVLMPHAGAGPGTPLWGEPPRRQPIVPLLAMALVVLLVCAPAAMSSGGGSANPLQLMRDTARATYELAGLVDEANVALGKIDANAKTLTEMAGYMEGIRAASEGMQEKTERLSVSLAGVGAAVSESRGQLVTVDRKLAGTARGMAAKRATVSGSLRSTERIVGEFGQLDASIDGMDGDLEEVIGLMSASTPQTRAFAQNTTRLSIAGGDGRKYDVVNVVPGSRVMSVMLNMIGTMQRGGSIAARKDRAEASNPLVGTLLARQVPDGTNVNAIIQPFDGTYGLPGERYFISTPVNGF